MCELMTLSVDCGGGGGGGPVRMLPASEECGLFLVLRGIAGLTSASFPLPRVGTGRRLARTLSRSPNRNESFHGLLLLSLSLPTDLHSLLGTEGVPPFRDTFEGSVTQPCGQSHRGSLPKSGAKDRCSGTNCSPQRERSAKASHYSSCCTLRTKKINEKT